MSNLPEVKTGNKVAYTRPDGVTVIATVIGGGELAGVDLLAPIPGGDLYETVNRVPHSSQLKTAFWEETPQQTPGNPLTPANPETPAPGAPASKSEQK